MNTPTPAIAPPPSPAAMPTLGSILGSVLGSVIVAKTGLSVDPVLAGSVITGITGVFTGLFHWIGTRIGANW
jgi:hypothetical protein